MPGARAWLVLHRYGRMFHGRVGAAEPCGLRRRSHLNRTSAGGITFRKFKSRSANRALPASANRPFLAGAKSEKDPYLPNQTACFARHSPACRWRYFSRGGPACRASARTRSLVRSPCNSGDGRFVGNWEVADLLGTPGNIMTRARAAGSIGWVRARRGARCGARCGRESVLQEVGFR